MNNQKILQLAKGFRGRSKNCIRAARERVEKALQYAYRDRRNKKRDMRGLWIDHISVAQSCLLCCVLAMIYDTVSSVVHASET